MPVTATPHTVQVLRCFNLTGGRRCGRDIGSSSQPMVATRVLKNVRDIRPGCNSSWCKSCGVATEFKPEDA